MTDVSIPAPPRPGRHYSDSLILYGVKLNDLADYASLNVGQGGDTDLRVQLFKGRVEQKSRSYSIVQGYGYAFEGHCYRLDLNRIFIVTGPRAERAVGCGFDPQPTNPPPSLSYRMWRIRASTELLEITTNFGDARKLILDANLPGKRSPSAYAITMSMAHRDGRLTRD